MRELPIIFSAPMVRALLEGRKTQTRRVVKLPALWARQGQSLDKAWRDPGFGDGEYLHVPMQQYGEEVTSRLRCPYADTPGDRLWVRETWSDLTETHGQPWERRDPATGLYVRGKKSFAWYRADGEQPGMGDDDCAVSAQPWRPSIFMPRWASRLTLEVTDVRVQRLQEISEEDAQAEGVEWESGDPPFYYVDGLMSETGFGIEEGPKPAAGSYAKLWDLINAKRAPWSANPWVWVIAFRRLP